MGNLLNFLRPRSFGQEVKPHQLRGVSRITMNEEVEESSTGMDILGSLPVEMFHEILKYLSPQDLYNVRNGCQKWRDHMQSFWKIKCKMEGFFENEDDLNSEFYRKFMENFSQWEGIYLYNSKLNDNWISQNYVEITNHDDEIRGFAIKYLCGDVIIGTVRSNQIWVINATTAVVEKRFQLTFPKGTIVKDILAVEKIENRLIVVVSTVTRIDYGSFLYPEVVHVKSWNIETEELLLNLKMETVEYLIEKVLVYKHLIALYTSSSTLHVYNLGKKDFDYFRCRVSSICTYNHQIAVGNYTGTIVIMDLNYTELMTLECCESDRSITEIQMKGKYLISMSGITLNASLRACIWNMEIKVKLYEVENVFQLDLAIYLYENKIFYECGTFGNGIFKLCHLDTGKCILELASGYIGVNNSFVIQRDTNDGHLLKLWSIKTGKLIADLQLPQPFTENFFCHRFYHKKAKSKFAYMDFDSGFHVWFLRIMDFEAKIDIQ